MPILQITSISNNAGSALTLANNDFALIGVGINVLGSTYGLLGSGNGQVNNQGYIAGLSGGLSFASGTLSLRNGATGTIYGNTGIVAASTTYITNFGTISGATYGINATSLTVTNFGTISGGTAIIGTGNLTLDNKGIIEGDIVYSSSTGILYLNSTLGVINGGIAGTAQADFVIGGQTGGNIDGAGGNDYLYANATQAAADNRAITYLNGGAGNNALYGGGGFNNFLLGLSSGGTNQVWGHASMMSDVAGYANNAIYCSATKGAYVDLLNGHNVYFSTGTNWTGSGTFEDWVQNVPNVFGSNYADVIQADGTGGRIQGNGGADALYGATGRDVFVYTFSGESTILGGYDTIVNFERGTDKIDLTEFMAANGLGPNSLVLNGSGNSTTVYVERIPGSLNTTTDLAFVVNSTAGVLTAADFIL